MISRPILAALFGSAALFANEVASVTLGTEMEMESMVTFKDMMKMKVKSKDQIMANMTMEQAVSMVMKMNMSSQDPTLRLLLDKVGGAGEVKHHTLRGAKINSTTNGTGNKSVPDGYAAVKGAMDLINSMMKEAQMKLDLSVLNCDRFERNQMVLLEETQADVASFNGLAAEARGGVLHEQAIIGMLTEKIPQVEYELGMHRRTCDSEQAALNYQLGIIANDIEVVKGIITSLEADCPAHPTPPPPTAPAFIQTEENSSGHDLMMCAHCRRGGMMMLQHDNIQPMLNKLKSETAKGYVQKHLEMAFRQSRYHARRVSQEQIQHQIALLQGTTSHHHRRKHIHKKADGDDDETGAKTIEIDPGLHLTVVPVPPTPGECVPTLKCSLKPSSCKRIFEKFKLVEGGIIDKQNELKAELRQLEAYCEETSMSLMGQLSSMGTQLREAQTGLAMNTKMQIDAESSAAQKGRQHAELKQEYTTTLDQCCEDQNTERSEMCALVKIRGEATKMKGPLLYFTDCEVGPWVEEDCSMSCGGGTRKKNREILVQPVMGMECPPVSMEEECNIGPCPVDCVLEDWSGWSACSAACGGGVIERARSVRTPAQNGGEPCDETEEEMVCNIQACDRDCILSDWSGWNSCNAACDGGHMSRNRAVASEALGAGTCADPTDPERIGFEPCNQMPCELILPQGRPTLECNSMVDVVIVMDSSGSLGEEGWKQTKALTVKLVEALNAANTAATSTAGDAAATPAADAATAGGDASTTAAEPLVKVAVLVYSSWNTRFVTHLTDGTTVADVEGIEWIAWGTETAQALGMAQGEFLYGREDATSIVLVITDGQPYSPDETKEAAEKLKEKARVMWVPVGMGAPLELIHEMASEPKEDHVVYVSEFEQMTDSHIINKIVANTCPFVK